MPSLTEAQVQCLMGLFLSGTGSMLDHISDQIESDAEIVKDVKLALSPVMVTTGLTYAALRYSIEAGLRPEHFIAALRALAAQLEADLLNADRAALHSSTRGVANENNSSVVGGDAGGREEARSLAEEAVRRRACGGEPAL